jgi:small-conductance mechanosensitive channel
LTAFIACSLVGVQAAGIPIAWDAKIPGIGLSVLVVFRLLILLAVVFWLSSRLKRFFFTRFLSGSGLDRALQYTIAQIVGYLILIIGAAIALQNAGIDLSALAIFAGAVGVGLGFGLQDIARNLSAASSFSSSGRSKSATAWKWIKSLGRCARFARGARPC